MYNETNNYCEVLISRQPDRMVSRAMTAYVVLAVITGILAVIVHILYLLLTALCLFLRWRLQQKANVEFEYQFWGRQLDVDCIFGSAKRQQLVSYAMDEVELVARADDPVVEQYQSLLPAGEEVKTRDLTDREPDGRPVYVMYAREDLNLVRVLLQPSHEMLRQMWRIAPRVVHIPDSIREEPKDPEDLEEA